MNKQTKTYFGRDLGELEKGIFQRSPRGFLDTTNMQDGAPPAILTGAFYAGNFRE